VVKLPFSPTDLLLHGPHIKVLISATRVEVVEGRPLGLEFPDLPIKALIDTGASLTVINPEIATTCKLKQTGHQTINAVGGKAGEFPAYAAAISFPGTELPGLDATRVVACPIIRQPFFSCLIGRDIMRKWRFIYDGRTGEIEITV
jgi:predicted aspartyl protease